MPDGPITKENLLSALEYGRLHKDKRKSSDWYVEMIEEHQVSFKLTPDDEKEIRRRGNYLGDKGLDDLVAAIHKNYRSAAQPSSWQLSGKILNGRQPYDLAIGSGHIIGITSETLRNGINLGEVINQMFQLGDGKINLPVKLYEENNRLMVDAELYNEKQVLVCSIVRSEWQFNPDGEYDRNYSNNAFEVVDGNLIPVLQIYLKEPNKIYVGGFLRTDKGATVGLTPNKILINPIEKDLELKRLFRYPSRENPGKLEVENLPSFDRFDDELTLAQQVESNKLKYSQLTNEELKLKVAAFTTEITKLYELYLFQDERLDNEERNDISVEAFKQIMEAIRLAKSPEEREKARHPLVEHQEKFIKKKEEIEKPIIETYKRQMRLDAILMRDEILRRLQRVPEREYRVGFLNIVYAGNFGAFRLRDVIGDLQLLAAKLP